jgi:hypothetical protein
MHLLSQDAHIEEKTSEAILLRAELLSIAAEARLSWERISARVEETNPSLADVDRLRASEGSVPQKSKERSLRITP